MGIKFASGGFLTTVQDMGRTGYRESGMSRIRRYGSAFRSDREYFEWEMMKTRRFWK